MDQPIEASTTIPAAFSGVREVLLGDPGSVVSDASTADEREAGRFRVDLEVNIGAGASVHQEVMLQLGPAESGPDQVVVPMAWHATGKERLFPRFAGELRAAQHGPQTSLNLSGTYHVPLGAVGKVGDTLAGRRLARRSLGALAERIAACLHAHAETAGPSPPVEPESASYPVDLQDGEHSELYIG